MRYIFLHAGFFQIVILVFRASILDFSWSRFLRRWSSAFDRLRLMGLVALLMRQPWLCRLHSQLALMASINVAVVACWQWGRVCTTGLLGGNFCDGFLEFCWDLIIWLSFGFQNHPWLTTYKPLGTHHPGAGFNRPLRLEVGSVYESQDGLLTPCVVLFVVHAPLVWRCSRC